MKREELAIPFFADRKDLFKFLKENKNILMAQKKAVIKHGDGIAFNQLFYNADGTINKGVSNGTVDLSSLVDLKVKVAINTTNFLDSHGDVHIPGLWKKSLSENKMIMHLQEHTMQFDHIIADGADLKAYTQNMSWKELGFAYPGNSEVLTFESLIRKQRNPYMIEQYGKGYVKNHSVGMQYVSMVLCVNVDSEYYGAEFEAWQKYIEVVANRQDAEDAGYFWAIKEAKVIEGSAVPRGSNYATPTLDNNMKNAPSNHAKTPPAKTTGVNYRKIAEGIFNN